MILTVGFFLVANAIAQEWPRFRGLNGTGVSAAKGIPSKFDISDANWRVELKGEGHSSPILWGDKVFVTSLDSKESLFYLQCLNAKDGSELWRASNEQKMHRTHRYNLLVSSSPVTDGKHLIVVTSQKDAHCVIAYDLTGKKLWEQNFPTIISNHGSGVSPIIYNGKVILAGDEDNQSFLAAINVKTGKVLWKVNRINAKAAFSTPCEFTDPSGTKGLIFNSMGHGITFVNPSTGKTYWEQSDVFDKRSVSSSVVAGELLIGTCGSGGGGNYLVALKPGSVADGGKPSLAYKLRRSIPYVPTSVARGDLLFLWGDAGVVTCVKAQTGDIEWQERVEGRFFGSPVWVEDRLFCISTSGKVVVVAASKKFKMIEVNELGEASNATPALAKNRIYFRTLGHLVSFGNN